MTADSQQESLNVAPSSGRPVEPIRPRKARQTGAQGAHPVPFEAVLETVSDGLVGISRDWQYTYANSAAARFLRRPVEELLSRSVFDAFPEAKGTAFEQGFRQAMEQGVATTFEAYYPPLEAWFECRCYPSPDGINVLFTDTTARKRGEQAMQALKEQAERVAEQFKWLARIPQESPNPTLRISAEHVILYANPAAEDLCNYWSCWKGQKVPPIIQEIVSAALNEGTMREHEITCGPRIFWLSVAPYPADGYVNIVARDITDRRRAGMALREARQQAEWLGRFPRENPNPVLRVSFDGNVLYRNPATTTTPGWACEVGNPLPRPLLPLFSRAMAQELEVQEDVPLGEMVYAVSVVPIPEECYANIYGRDVTKRVQAEEALRQANELLRAQTQEFEAANEELNTQAEELAAQAEELRAANEELRQHERVVRKAHERLVLAQEAAGAGMWNWDIETGQLEWSPELFRLFGLEPDATGAAFDSWRAVIHPEDRQAAEERIHAAVRNHVRLQNEYRVVLPTGETRWINAIGDTSYDDSGRPLRMTGFCLDITERKQMERSVRESEGRLRAMLNHLPVGVWFADQEGRIVYGNEAGQRIWAGARYVGPDQFHEYRGWWWGTGKPIGPEEWAVVRAVRRGETSLNEVIEIQCFDGTRKIIRNSTVPVREDNDRILGAVILNEDITQRIRDEQTLKESEGRLKRLNDQLEDEVQAQTEELRDSVERLQDEVARRVLAEGMLRRNSRMLEAFFQHTITPLAFMDRHFNLVRVNEAYALADDKDPEYFVGKNHFAIYPHEENQAIFERVVRSRRPYRAYAKPFSYPEAPERGVTYWNWQLTPLLDERGDVQFLVLNLEDVTEQQKAFHELEQRARQLQQLTLELSQAEDRERRRLAEILHDDLQQVLAAAKFHLGLLSSRTRQDATMHELIVQLDQMLRDAIEKSRSLSHELSPAVLYRHDLGETFQWLAQQTQTKHGLAVRVDICGEIELQSDGLKTLLYKAAQEILFNVVKHAGTQEARLRLRRVGGRLRLTIGDKGQGFDPAALGKTSGFGLLSIRERVELLGGHMRVKSAKGKGSVFLIALPADRTPKSARDGSETGGPAVTPLPAGSDKRADRPAEHRLRVLLVDDHKVMREGLAALLKEQRDIEVVGQAGNGREAVDLALQLRPDVVVMDVAMPLMAGDEATRRIKMHLPQTRVLTLSMFGENEMSEKMRRAGAEVYLLKTAPSDQLLAAIRGTESRG